MVGFNITNMQILIKNDIITIELINSHRNSINKYFFFFFEILKKIKAQRTSTKKSINKVMKNH